MPFLSTLLISILTPIALIPFLTRAALRLQLVDLPGERKVHRQPIPRIGGIAIALGGFIPVLLWCRADQLVRGYLPAAALLVAFGLVDDLKDLSPRYKLFGQFAAALIVVWLGGVKITSLGALLPEGYLLPDAVAIPLTLLAIVGVTNAINLSDGLDGLAGGICVLSFCCLGYLAYLQGDATAGLTALALLGAIFGFLRFNTYPATVFMGDTGSQLLGFSAITLALRLTQGNSALSPLLPLILLGFPVLDTMTVMTVRIAQGRSPFSADKNHFHHNLMSLGLHHEESVLTIYLIQMLLVLAAFRFRFHSDWLLLAGYLLFCGATLALFTVSTRNHWRLQQATSLLRARRALRRLKGRRWAIRFLFRLLDLGLPLLLVFTLVLPGPITGHGAAMLLLLPVPILYSLYFRDRWLGDLLRLTLYLLIPFAVYRELTPALPLPRGAAQLHNISIGAFALFNILISKLSLRHKGFRSTPLDFLILFITLVVPNLPEHNIEEYHLGMVAAKVVILYYSSEVLLAELRGDYSRLALTVTVALVLAGAWGGLR